MNHSHQLPRALQIDRRRVLQLSLGAAAAACAATPGAAQPGGQPEASPTRQAVRGRIRQSIVNWCFAKHWNLEQTAAIAAGLGCQSVELVSPSEWQVLKKYGLVCALAGSHSFVQGMNHVKYHEGCIERMRRSIDACADAGFPAVITFTGFAQDTGPWNGGNAPAIDPAQAAQFIDQDEGLRNCVAGYKKVVGYAEAKGVNISLEMLNSRVNETMKGHPGYQGDHLDYCLEIAKQVGSPRFGLLFDIYHVQIMDGDVIRRLRQCGELVNHVHTAGNPGRGELDDQQEINYPPIMRALTEMGYQGFVGQEFIPTRDPLEGLSQAVRLCDV